MDKKSYKNTLYFMYKCSWDERPRHILYLIIDIILVAIQPFINILFIDDLINLLLEKKNMMDIVVYAVIIILGNSIVSYLKLIVSQLRKKEEDWLQVLFYRMLNKKAMEINYIDLEKPSILDKYMQASDGLWYSNGIQGISNSVATIISGSITIVGTTIVMMEKIPLLAFLVTIITILNAYFIAENNKIDVEFLKKLPRINRVFSYVFLQLASRQYAKDIRMYGAEEMILEIGKDTTKEQYNMFVENGKKKYVWERRSTYLITLKDVLGLGYLGYKALKKQINIGELNSLYAATSSFSGALYTIVQNVQNLKKNLDFLVPVFEYLEIPIIKDTNRDYINVSDVESIEFVDVGFKYQDSDTYALNNINIKITKGEHITLVGFNGAGKTTFVKLLMGLYKPTYGKILVNGIDINNIDKDSYRNVLGVVFQDYKLFSFTLEENVKFGRMEYEDSVSEACKKCGLSDLINKLENGKSTIINKDYDANGVELSGGEAQKVAIARLEYRNAQVSILDEPTSALDPIAEREFYDMFKKNSDNRTVIFISHRMSSCKFSDRVYVFENGNIIQEGSHEDLMGDKQKLYYRMFNEQAKFY